VDNAHILLSIEMAYLADEWSICLQTTVFLPCTLMEMSIALKDYMKMVVVIHPFLFV
jgi:hypothetical protein